MNLSPKRLPAVALVFLSLCAASVSAQTAPEPETTAAAETLGPVAVANPEVSAHLADPAPTAQNDTGGVTINGRYFPPPMAGKERWDKYVRDTYTGFPIYAASLGAALGDQSRNNPQQWGKSWEGYGKRVGTQYASFAIQTSLYQGGSALLRNEGRYVACQCSGVWHRAGYAFQMSFFTYHDRKKVLDVPQFAAAYAAGIIPVLWYPQGYSVSAQGVQNGTYQLGFVVLVREIQEFAPELTHFFGKFKP